jgi:hypothetical protein
VACACLDPWANSRLKGGESRKREERRERERTGPRSYQTGPNVALNRHVVKPIKLTRG